MTGFQIPFTASCMAVLRAWTFVYPTLVSSAFYFLYISFTDIACCVHALRYLVQIAANFSECSIVFQQIPASAAYGKFNNIFLSDAEVDGLKAELPDKWEYFIDRLSVHIASSGKQYRNNAATIYKWSQEDAGKTTPKKGMPDYSYSEEDSL